MIQTRAPVLNGLVQHTVRSSGRVSISVSMPACHAGELGSTPRRGAREFHSRARPASGAEQAQTDCGQRRPHLFFCWTFFVSFARSLFIIHLSFLRSAESITKRNFLSRAGAHPDSSECPSMRGRSCSTATKRNTAAESYCIEHQDTQRRQGSR